MAKVDHKTTLRHLYAQRAGTISVVDVPRLGYLMIDGAGAPDGPEARAALQALYPVAYRTKFLMKARGSDFVVMPLEGLWWADDMGDFQAGRRDRWQWTYMILMPDLVTADVVAEAIAAVDPARAGPARQRVRLEPLEEGRAAQVLYTGPYAEEGPTIQQLHAHIASLGGTLTGRHHEIYLSDPRRTEPAKLRTIIRQPFAVPAG
jgi:hypothetical protein